jgi:hypothetical protein
MPRRLVLAFLLALVVSSPAASGPPPVEATADDFGWLAGTWRGSGLGGECEEIWSPPMAGTMVGTFRLIRDDQVVFYELMLLESDEQGFAMKLKHFAPDFTAWEEGGEHVRFSLVEVAPGRATFEGLTLELDGEVLTVRVRLKREGEEARWEPFVFRKQPS